MKKYLYLLMFTFATLAVVSCSKDVTDDLQSQITQLEQTIQTLQANITTLEGQISSASAANSSLSQQLSAAQTALNNATALIAAANVDINALLKFHNKHKKIVTMTSVQPEGRFGAVITNNEYVVTDFEEKPNGDGAWINGGFFVCNKKVLDYIDDDSTMFERTPLEKLTKEGELAAYQHRGFWKPMDTLRDKTVLENAILNNKAPWVLWDTK